MNIVSIFKDVAGLVVSIGVSSIVGNAIKLTADPEAKLPKKIAVGIGGVVLSGMVSEAAQKYAEEKIDRTVSAFTKVKDVAEKIAEDIESDEPGVAEIDIVDTDLED